MVEKQRDAVVNPGKNQLGVTGYQTFQSVTAVAEGQQDLIHGADFHRSRTFPSRAFSRPYRGQRRGRVALPGAIECFYQVLQVVAKTPWHLVEAALNPDNGRAVVGLRRQGAVQGVIDLVFDHLAGENNTAFSRSGSGNRFLSRFGGMRPGRRGIILHERMLASK
ncbi:MAG: hypothetical protein Kow00129_00780 [Thermoleophilia bacterium]